MAEKQDVSDLYKKNAEKAEKDKRLRDAVSIFFILFGSVIVAVNLNTFVEQGKLVPGGFSGLAKLIQRVGLAFFDVKISFTFLNVFLTPSRLYLPTALSGKSLRFCPV